MYSILIEKTTTVFQRLFINFFVCLFVSKICLLFRFSWDYRNYSANHAFMNPSETQKSKLDIGGNCGCCTNWIVYDIQSRSLNLPITKLEACSFGDDTFTLIYEQGANINNIHKIFHLSQCVSLSGVLLFLNKC